MQNLRWQTYHTPENLILFLLGEVAEVGEYCQWLSPSEVRRLGLLRKLSEEIIDVIKNILYLGNVLFLPRPSPKVEASDTAP